MTAPNSDFELAVRRYYGLTPGSALPDDQRAVWYQYAMDTNKRGEALSAQLSVLVGRDWDDATVLDVGCGYGGLMRALIRQGARAVGVEKSEQLAELARLNLSGEPSNAWQLIQGSIEEQDETRLGTFDLIVCDNVLEHVDDPQAVIGVLEGLLNTDGIIYIAVPSCASPAQIRSDPHFGLPGIVLLNRDDAEKYYFEVHPDSKEYGVGIYGTPDDYFGWLNGAGLNTRFAASTTYLGENFRCDMSRVDALSDEVDKLVTVFDATLSSALSESVSNQLRSSLAQYKEEFSRQLKACRLNPDGPEVRLFLEWYGPLVWHFLAWRKLGALEPSWPPTLCEPNPASQGSVNHIRAFDRGPQNTRKTLCYSKNSGRSE